jgi:hypothetical protein
LPSLTFTCRTILVSLIPSLSSVIPSTSSPKEHSSRGWYPCWARWYPRSLHLENTLVLVDDLVCLDWPRKIQIGGLFSPEDGLYQATFFEQHVPLHTSDLDKCETWWDVCLVRGLGDWFGLPCSSERATCQSKAKTRTHILVLLLLWIMNRWNEN